MCCLTANKRDMDYTENKTKVYGKRKVVKKLGNEGKIKCFKVGI